MLYKFRITMNDHPDMERVIEILSEQTFEELHKAILDSVDFDDSQLASFYLCDEDWNEELEITLIDMSDEVQHTFSPTMGKTKLEEYWKEEDAKLKYVYDFVAMWNFNAELIEIKEKAGKKTLYPRNIEKNGDAPSQYEGHFLPTDITADDLLLLEELKDKNHKIINHKEDEFASEFTDLYDDDDDEEEEEDPFDAGFDEYEGGGHGHGHDDY